MAGNIEEMKSLVDQDKFQKAYELATESLDQFEGDPEFDLYYAIAAIDTGRLSEGIFALDRILLLKPDNSVAKLELARAYFLIGQFEKSKYLFEQVRSLNPPENVSIRIAQFLAMIDQRTTVSDTKFSSFVEVWAGYDSNINSGPDSQATLVALTESALGRGDMFSQLKLGGSVEHQYSADGALNFSINADLRYYDTEPTQDYRNITVSGGHTWYQQDQQYLLNFVAQQYSLDYEDYRDLLGVNLGWNKQLSKNSVLKSFIGVNQLSYDDASWKDATQTSAGLNFLYGGEGSWDPIYFAGIFVGEEDPKTSGILADGQVDRVFYGGNLGVQLSPVSNATLTPALTYQSSRYQGDDWIYGIKRKDDLILFNLNLTWQLDKSWVALANYSYTEADSNIELYGYDRQQIMVGIRYNFQ
jgi:hypothetical protein